MAALAPITFTRSSRKPTSLHPPASRPVSPAGAPTPVQAAPPDALTFFYVSLRRLRAGEVPTVDTGIEIGDGYILDRVKYEARYGPGSLDRDRALYDEAINQLRDLPEKDIPKCTADGFLVPLDELRARVAAVAKPIDPIYDSAEASLPSEPPRSHKMHRAWEGMAHEALRTEWKRRRRAGAVVPGTFIRKLSQVDRTPPRPLILNRLDPANATLLFGPGDPISGNERVSGRPRPKPRSDIAWTTTSRNARERFQLMSPYALSLTRSSRLPGSPPMRESVAC